MGGQAATVAASVAAGRQASGRSGGAGSGAHPKRPSRCHGAPHQQHGAQDVFKLPQRVLELAQHLVGALGAR